MTGILYVGYCVLLYGSRLCDHQHNVSMQLLLGSLSFYHLPASKVLDDSKCLVGEAKGQGLCLFLV